MNYFIEYIGTSDDLALISLECDIQIERAEYLLNYSNLYLESKSNSSNTKIHVIKKAINSIKDFINKVSETISNLINGSRMKALESKYNKVVKEHPELKDIKIDYTDYTDINDEHNKNIDALVKSGTKPKHNKEMIKPVVKTIVGFGAAIAGLAYISKKISYINKSNKVIKIQNQILDLTSDFKNKDMSESDKEAMGLEIMESGLLVQKLRKAQVENNRKEFNQIFLQLNTILSKYSDNVST